MSSDAANILAGALKTFIDAALTGRLTTCPTFCGHVQELINTGIQEYLNNEGVETKDITGLDDAIESWCDNNPIKARDVDGLDDYVTDLLDDEVDKRIDRKVDTKFSETTLSAQDIDNFDEAVAEVLERHEGVVQHVTKALDDPTIRKALLHSALTSPEGQQLLDSVVRQSLMRVVMSFLAGALPIANPVPHAPQQ